MKLGAIGWILLITTLPYAYAYNLSSYDAVFEIEQDHVRVYSNRVFSSEGPASIAIAAGAYDLNVSVPYTLGEDPSVINIEQPGRSVEIEYKTTSLFETSERINFFTFSFQGDPTQSYNITVRLPVGGTLHYLDGRRPSYMPATGKLHTDGRRIQLHWNTTDFAISKAVVILYDLEQEQGGTMAWYALGIGLSLAAAWLAYRMMNGTSAAIEFSTANLFEEEKTIVHALKKNPDGIWQKQLAHQTGLSKVKLSRRIRALEQKGLVEKIPYGNTNKIRLKSA